MNQTYHRILLSVLTLLLVAESRSAAATLTWTGAGGDSSTSTAANWSPAQVPQAGDVLIFAGSQRLTPQMGANLTVGSITFNSTALAFTLGGTGIYTINNGGITNNSTAAETINNAIRLGAAQTWNAASGPLGIFGTVNNLGFRLTTAGANNVTIGGAISGSGGLTKNGTGALLLSGNNSYTGDTIASAGTLIIGSNTALGTGLLTLGAVTVQANGGARTLANAFTYTNNVTFSGVDDITFNGPLTLGKKGTLTFSGPGVVTFNGVVSANKKLTKAGPGTLVLNGANTYGGTTTLSAGTLVVGNDSAVGTATLSLGTATLSAGGTAHTLANNVTLAGNTTFGGANNLTLAGNSSLTASRTLTVTNPNTTFSGVVSGASFALTKAGTGTLTFSGTSANTFSGGLNVNDGTVVLAKTAGLNAFVGTLAIGDGLGAAGSAIVQHNAANQIPNASAVTLRSDGLLNLQTFTEAIGALTTSGGSVVGGVGSRLDLGGNLTASATGSAVTTISANVGLAASRIFQINDNSVASDVDLNVSSVISGAGFSLTKTGAGTLELGGANTYSGGTDVLAGTLLLDASSAGAITSGPLGTGAVNLGDTTGAAPATLLFTGTAGHVVANAITVRAGTTGTLTLGGLNTTGVNKFTGAVTLNVSATLTAAAGGEVDFNGLLSGVGGVTKIGSGIVRLAFANTFSGAVNVNAGTLAYGLSNALAANAVTINGGTLDLGASNTDTVGAVTLVSGAITGTGISTLTSTSGFSLQSGTVSAALSGAVAVTKSTAGTVILSGANTYTGATSIGAGTVQLGVAQGLPASSAVTIGTGATLDLAGFNDTIGSLVGAGTISLGAGRLTFGSDNTSTSFSGAITGSGGLSKAGSGTFTIGGASSYTGSTNIDGGVLRLSAASGVPTASRVTVAAGAQFDLNGFSVTIGSLAGGGSVTLGAASLTAGGDGTSSAFSGVISGSGSFTKTGAGALTFSGTNSFTGTLTVGGSSLTLSGANGRAAATTAISLAAGGQLVLDNTAGENFDRLSNSAPIQFSGGELRFVSSVNASAETVGALNALGSSSATVVHNAGTLLSSSLTFSSLGTLAPGAVINFTATGGVLGSGVNGPHVFITGLPVGILGSWARVGSDFAEYTVDGITAFLGYYTASDGINVNDPTRIVLLSSASPSTAYTLSNNGTTTDRGLNLTDIAAVDLSSNQGRILNLADGGLIKSAAPATTISGNGKLTAGKTSAGSLNVSVETSRTLTIASRIIDNAGPNGINGDADDGVVSLVKADGGVLVLTGANTYSGGNFIEAGTLEVGADGALGAAQNDVTFDGGTLHITSGFQANAGRTFSISAGLAGTIDIDAVQTLTIGGANGLLAAGSTTSRLNKTGSGSLVLLDANAAFIGTLEVDAGAVELRNADALGTSAQRGPIALAGGTLRLRADAASVFGNDVTILANSTIDAARLTGTTPAVAFTLGHVAIGAQTLSLSATNGAELVLADAAMTGAATFRTTAGTTKLGTISGAFGFTKDGAGTLELTGSAGYAGATNVLAGVLRLDVADALSASSDVTLAAGTTLDVNSPSATLGSLSGSGTVTLGTGSVTVGGNGASTTFSGAINGTGGLTKAGTGTLTLAGMSGYLGTTNVNAGTLRTGVASALATTTDVTIATGATFDLNGFNQTVASLAGAGSVTLGTGTLNAGSGGGTTTFSGAINGTGGLVKTGLGALTLSGANTFSGTTKIVAGALQVGSSDALGSAVGGTTVDAGAELILASGVAINGESLTLAGTGVAGSGALHSPTGTTSWSGTLSLGGDTKIGADAGLFRLDGSVALGGHSLNLAAAGEIDIPASIAGSGDVTKSGAGPLVLSGANSFAGSVLVVDGEVRVRHGSAFGLTGATNGTSVLSGASIVFDGASGVKVGAESLVLAGSGYGGIGALASNAGDNDWDGPIALGADSAIGVAGNGTLTLSGVISEMVSGRSLNKIGSGTLILGGANSFTGSFSIDGGFVQLAGDERIDDAASVVLAPGAVLNLADATETLSALSGAGEVQLGADGTALLRLGFGGVSSLYSGAIIGVGDLAKLGAGTLTLTGANSFTGSVTINGGVIAIDAEARLGSGPLTLDGGGIRALADFALGRDIDVGAGGGEFDTNGHTLVLSGALSGAGDLLKLGAGTLQLAGASSSFTGTITIASGLLNVSGSLGSAPTIVEAGAELSGSGTVGDTTALAGATVTPGSNLGRLTTGPFSLQSGAKLVLELGGVTAGTQYDQLRVIGGVSLSGELRLSLVNGFTPQVGDKFFLVLNDGTDPVSGGFSNVIGGMITIPFATFSVSMADNGDFGPLGNDVSVTYVAVPEPGSCSLLGAGLLLGALRRRRVAGRNK